MSDPTYATVNRVQLQDDIANALMGECIEGDWEEEDPNSLHGDYRIKPEYQELYNELYDKASEMVDDAVELKRFKFYNERVVHATDEQSAKDEFARSAYNFAGDADCQPLDR